MARFNGLWTVARTGPAFSCLDRKIETIAKCSPIRQVTAHSRLFFPCHDSDLEGYSCCFYLWPFFVFLLPLLLLQLAHKLILSTSVIFQPPLKKSFIPTSQLIQRDPFAAQPLLLGCAVCCPPLASGINFLVDAG